ncbi:MAG: hypothetical protein DMG97_34210, partial [Acidobacteria bacterium]
QRVGSRFRGSLLFVWFAWYAERAKPASAPVVTELPHILGVPLPTELLENRLNRHSAFFKNFVQALP